MSENSTPFTAIILAADRGPDDPVAQAAGVSCKALTPINGTPMVLRVLKALSDSQEVGPRILCGPPRAIMESVTELREGFASGDFGWLESRATPSTSAYAALETLAEKDLVLLTTADHALLNPRIVDHFCAEARASDCDVLIALTPSKQVYTAFPGIRRTVLKFRGGGYCGCNLFAFMSPRARSAANFWRRVEKQRKKPLKVIGVVGWMAVLRYLLGTLSLDMALEGLSRRMNLRVGAVIMPFPTAAVDVDKVSDWTFAQQLAEGLSKEETMASERR